MKNTKQIVKSKQENIAVAPRNDKFSETCGLRSKRGVEVRFASVSNSSVLKRLKYFNLKIKHDIERSLRLSLFYFVCIMNVDKL